MNAAQQGTPADVTKFAYANLVTRLSLGVGPHRNQLRCTSILNSLPSSAGSRSNLLNQSI
jgi:hypothetical protein